MNKHDEAKKGARFTMCQAALQGGADVSIVPKVMDYIETGDADALRYLSPCESLEKEVGNRTAMYQELQIKNDELKSALVDLREEYEKIHNSIDGYHLEYHTKSILSSIDKLKELTEKYIAEKQRVENLTIDDIEI
jgi:predicted RNase H-like nuclease (RuvC/YqgF family)